MLAYYNANVNGIDTLQAPVFDLIDIYIRIYRALDFELVRFALTQLERPLRFSSPVVLLDLLYPLIMGSPPIPLIEMPRRCHVAASLSLSLALSSVISQGKVYQLSGDPCLVARLSLSLSRST
jgi:hypothetical protein